MQFGDDIMGSATDEMRAMLERKNQWKREFHGGRLQEHGMTPMRHHAHMQVPASHADPEEQAVEAFDRVKRPSFLAHEAHDEAAFESASEATVSPPPSPRAPGALERVRRAGFEVAGKVGHGTAQLAKATGSASIRATSSGLEQLQNVGSATARATARATSSSASHLRDGAAAAMEPGSNTRRALAAVANSTAGVLAAGASGAKQALEYAGPPMVHGAYAAAHAGRQLGTAGKEAATTAFHYIGDVAATHVVPAMQSMTKKGAEYALEALSATVLRGGDIVRALDEYKPQYSAHNALENGNHERLTYGAVSNKKRDRSPQARFHSGSASSSSTQGQANHFEHSYDSTQEWLEYSQNRGALVEELYKRPNWRSFITVSKEKNELRKKLLTLSPAELAEILVKLDHM